MASINFLRPSQKKLDTMLYSSILNCAYNYCNDFQGFLRNRVNSSIYFSPTTESEIENIIKDFKNDKASDKRHNRSSIILLSTLIRRTRLLICIYGS